MSRLAILIDSNQEHCEILDEISRKDYLIEIWVGCSKDFGFKTASILEELVKNQSQKKFLFPGRMSQGVLAARHTDYFLQPQILGSHSSKRRIYYNLISKFAGYVVDNAFTTNKTKRLRYGYLVLNGETSTVGKKIGAKNITDLEAINLVQDYISKEEYDFVYVEGGSGTRQSVSKRTDLLKTLKKIVGKELYAGGGIRTPEQFKKVSDITDCTVVGSVLERRPNLLKEFYDIVSENGIC